MEESISIGPWGQTLGNTYDYRPKGMITGLVIEHSTIIIHAITFKSTTGDLKLGRSDSVRGRVEVISFSRGEYITGIEFRYMDVYKTGPTLCSLCIWTNKTTYGTYGNLRGERMFIPITDGFVAGFHGCSLHLIYSFGIHAVPQAGKQISIGPWGSSEGESWIYNPQGLITKIVITHGRCIDSIIFESKGSNGIVTSSKQYGGTYYKKYGIPGTHTTDTIVLYSWEHITGIEMMVGEYDGRKVITLLSICTNMKTWGPFGTPTGMKISVPIKEGVVVGFFGRSGLCLNALGIFATKTLPPQEDEDDEDDDDDDPFVPVPVIVKPDSVIVKPEPVIVKPEPVVVKPDPIDVKPDPSIVKPDLAIEEPDPAIEEPDPAIVKPVCSNEVGLGSLSGRGNGIFAINKIFLNINLSVELNSNDRRN